MEPVYLFKLAAQKADWLAVRQAAISRNIANADTPGFKSSDVKPFQAVLNSHSNSVAATHDSHLGGNSGNAPSATQFRQEESWEISHSGNSVRLEQELMKAGEVSSEYTLQAGIMKSFHRMIMAVARTS